jgi:EF hand
VLGRSRNCFTFGNRKQMKTSKWLFFCSVLASLWVAGATSAPDDKEDFDRLDISGNGYLTGPEILPAIRSYDLDGNGNIDFKEFVAARAKSKAAPGEQKSAGTPQGSVADDEALWKKLDWNPDDVLDGKELEGGWVKYDLDKNGEVSKAEFLAGRAKERGTTIRPVGVRPTVPKSPPNTPPPASPTPMRLPALAARPGYVIGRAVFADGRPIPRFKVTALGWTGEVHLGAVGTAPNLGSMIAQNGQYAIRTTSEIDRRPVRARVTAVTASAILTHSGKEFYLELHPTDGKKDGSGEGSFLGDSGNGVVRDFILRLSGPKRGFERNTPPRDTNTNNRGDASFGAFYGGTVSLSLPRDAATLEGATLTATFTPTGPLYDGSASSAVVRTMILRKPDISTAYFRDIPLADYTLAVQITKAGAAPQALPIRILGGNLQGTAPVVFEPLSQWGVSTVTVISE